MKKISRFLIILSLLGAASCKSQSQKASTNLLPALTKPTGISEEEWLKDWTAKVTVNASLSVSDNYIYPNHYPVYSVRLTIKNKTDHQLITGNNLYLLETARQSEPYKQTTDVFEVIGGYFKQAPLEDYAGIIEIRGEPFTDNVSMGLTDWVTLDNRGGLYDLTGLLLYSLGHRSKYPTAKNFGIARPGDSLTIESEDLQLSIQIKPGKLSDVFVVSPLLKFGVNGEAGFRYILRFENGKTLSESVLLPMSAASLKRIAENNSELLWKRVFAVTWAGDLLEQDAAGPVLTAALQSSSPALKKAALNGIASAKYAPAFDDVLKIAQDRNNHPSIERAAILTLGKLADNRSTSFLLSIVADKKSVYRESAFEAISNLKDPSVQEPIMKMIESGGLPSETVALPKFDSSFTERLQNAATNRKANKNAAIHAIAKQNTPHAIEVLSQMYQQSDTKVRVQICDALKDIDNPAVESILVTALQDKDPVVRSYALSSLASVKSPSRNKILTDQLSNSDHQIVITAIREVSEARLEEAKPQILKILNDPSQKADIRRSAAESLVNYPDDESVKALIAALADREKDVRIEAAQTLASIPGKEQVPALTKSLSDSEMLVRLYSARALASLNGQSSCQPISDALLKESNGECADALSDCLVQIACRDPKYAALLITRLNSSDKRLRGAVGKYLSFVSGKKFDTGYDALPATISEATKVWTEWSNGNK